jgi:hypothetical protein
MTIKLRLEANVTIWTFQRQSIQIGLPQVIINFVNCRLSKLIGPDL